MEAIGAGRRIPTNSPLLEWASWRARMARAALSMAEACCGRPLAATADLMVALWGSRRWSGGSAMREESGRAGSARGGTRTGAGRRQWDAATQAHARAKRALWPRLEHARYVLV